VCFSASSDSKIAKQQRADEVARQARITSGMGDISNAFAGFDDQYYAKRAKDYVDYATPQLDQQVKEAHDKMVYALSRTGNLDSSAAIKRDNDLTRQTDAQRIGIANEGLNQANTARSNVESTRGNVVAELNATGDSSAAAQTALRQAQNLNTPQGYSPLGDLFAQFANGLSTIGTNAGNGYSGLVAGAKSLFSGGSGSQRVVG
jgi:hypothetical protein